jgi:hypothetical protein
MNIGILIGAIFVPMIVAIWFVWKNQKEKEGKK